MRGNRDKLTLHLIDPLLSGAIAEESNCSRAFAFFKQGSNDQRDRKCRTMVVWPLTKKMIHRRLGDDIRPGHRFFQQTNELRLPTLLIIRLKKADALLHWFARQITGRAAQQ